MINILDCTLRDGGHVNNADFKEAGIKGIVSCLNNSKVDIIELGFLKNGEFSKDVSNYNKVEEALKYLPCIINSEFSLMIRPDWYDISLLSANTGKINFLRFAFYYKDFELTKKYCKIAKDLGYKFFLNPVNMTGYKKDELKILAEEVNKIEPFALTMVDTFGSLTFDKLKNLYGFIEENLNQNISIDLHLNENLNLSFAIAQYFLKIKNPKRNVFLDASLYGMGRAPGNLPLELILEYTNSNLGANYDIDFVLFAINKYINPIKEQFSWGYHPAYYYSGKLNVHRSYPEFFLNQKVPLDKIKKILYEIYNSRKGAGFNKETAQSYIKRGVL